MPKKSRFYDFNTIPGVIFAFTGDRKQLLKKYDKLGSKLPSGSDSLRRYIAFFWLNRTDGMGVKMEERI